MSRSISVLSAGRRQKERIERKKEATKEIKKDCGFFKHVTSKPIGRFSSKFVSQFSGYRMGFADELDSRRAGWD